MNRQRATKALNRQTGQDLQLVRGVHIDDGADGHNVRVYLDNKLGVWVVLQQGDKKDARFFRVAEIASEFDLITVLDRSGQEVDWAAA